MFICLATKAVHLEVVSALTVEAFMATLRRFAARRGTPRSLYSDNATNFTGAAKEIRKLMMQEDAIDATTAQGFQWKFSPPRAPHFNGLWEAGVKSMKYHLHRVVGNTPLTYEEMATVTSQIEAVLNSRPLTAISEDPDDLEALTPGHFLIGAPLTAPPDVSHPIDQTPRTRWQLVQTLARHFWKRWAGEFLTRLQQRPKWLHPIPPLQKGQLVAIKEDDVAPLQWRLGRILEALPGPDGLVRVARLKTSTKEITRPIHRLCPLPYVNGDQMPTAVNASTPASSQDDGTDKLPVGPIAHRTRSRTKKAQDSPTSASSAKA